MTTDDWRNTFTGSLSSVPAEAATYDLEVQPATTGPLDALLWLVFAVALVCSPAVVLVAWKWAL